MARILVADDEAGIREFLAEALELDGHDGDDAPRTATRPRALLDEQRLRPRASPT